jgi:N-dimethylarginine dimethylaminohydrolase
VLSSCSDALRRTLEGHGYTVAKTPLQAFLRSGGSTCCLTLRLDHLVGAGHASAMTAA